MYLIANESPPVYRVDDLIVDVGRACVTRGTTQLEVPKLSFDLLLALIARAPAIVSPDDLMTLVWPGLVVSPDTISQRIKLLRGALGDDAREARYIAGVRGRGYRLVPEVILLAVKTDAISGAPVEPAATIPVPRPRRRWAWTAVVAALVLGAALIALLLKPPSGDPAKVAGEPPPRRSVAVLPFADLDGTPHGKALAFGISEALLHQLASVSELSVIARTSSFAATENGDDARAIGRKLSAHYLLEGGVQSEGERLRVTAQLIDTSSGEHVWSMRFDRAPQDVFALQDEIALAVTRALRLSLDSSAADRLVGRKAANLDAYFAYLQGRALATTLRIADSAAAAKQFAAAIRVDPQFAPAYVELANARLRVAEFDITPDREARFDAARTDAGRLIEKALSLDPYNSEAYAARAYVRAFDDLAAAESDYRKSIELSPSNASAHEGLAAVLYETPAKRDQALQVLDRARELDPLEPRYDVTKAVFLLYWRAQVDQGVALLREVLKRDPLYQPALMRLGEARACLRGEEADGLRYLEQAIDLDPRSDLTVSQLVGAYANTQQQAAAEDVLKQFGASVSGSDLKLAVERREWPAAAESAYHAIGGGTLAPYNIVVAAYAIRLHARETRDYQRALAVLEKVSGVTWNERGEPRVAMQVGVATWNVALGDLLILDGQAARGKALLSASLADMDRVMKQFGRGPFWYRADRATALALLGEKDAALMAIRTAMVDSNAMCFPKLFLEIEPAFAAMRADGGLDEIRAEARSHAAAQSAEIEKMRAEGLLPRRP